MSDSQASLAAINKQHTNSAIILQTVNELNKASVNNNINLLKVPAHTGLHGNEKADKLAKLATANENQVHYLKVKASVNSVIIIIKQDHT